MSIQTIKKTTGELIYSGEHDSLELAVEHCCKNAISLNGASLDGASLDRASLDVASLNGASLNGASLDRASLDWASLNGASLNGASLDEASLNGASLNGASLDRASLNGAKYSILSMLKINFYSISDKLTLELMRWDAISCGEEKMTSWSNGGPCPFSDSIRDFYFTENKSLWVPGSPTMNHRELWEALAKEKNIKIGAAKT